MDVERFSAIAVDGKISSYTIKIASSANQR